jgi:hypothetical protein
MTDLIERAAEIASTTRRANYNYEGGANRLVGWVVPDDESAPLSRDLEAIKLIGDAFAGAMRWIRVEDLPPAPEDADWRDGGAEWRGVRLGKMYLVRTNGAEWRDNHVLLVPAPMLMLWLEKTAEGTMVRGTPTHVCEVTEPV